MELLTLSTPLFSNRLLPHAHDEHRLVSAAFEVAAAAPHFAAQCRRNISDDGNTVDIIVTKGGTGPAVFVTLTTLASGRFSTMHSYG